MSTAHTDPSPSLIGNPRRLFRTVAIAEAITWAILLFGMFLKYGTKSTDLGVRIGGMVHGVIFLLYCVITVLVWVDNRWSVGRGVLGLLSAIPPFFTVIFDGYAERNHLLGESWRLRHEAPATSAEKFVATLVRRPLVGVLIAVAIVLVLTVIFMLVGPPAQK